MKDDFRAKRWPRQLLAGLMLIVLACLSDECVAMRDPELVAQAEKRRRLTEEAYPGSEREKGHIRRETLSAEETQIFDMFDKLGEQDKPVPDSLDKRLDAIHTEESEWKNWWEGKPTPVPAGTMKPPPMQAQATDIPPALYVDEPVDPIQKGTPIQFSMAFEFIDLDDICGLGRGRISMTLWNVGEQGGTEYGKVECTDFYPPAFITQRGSHGETCTAVIDYAENVDDFCVGLTFTGGENGKIINQSINREVIGHFIGGTTLIFLDNEIPVPDPSVFAGMQ